MAKREAQAREIVEEVPANPGLRLVVSRDTREVEALRSAEQAEASAVEMLEPSSPVPARPRNLARERLYADIGGTIIGLSAAATVINFVMLR